jgi:hypothetical protein
MNAAVSSHNVREEKMRIGTLLGVGQALLLWATVAAAPDKRRVTREIQTMAPAAFRPEQLMIDLC